VQQLIIVKMCFQLLKKYTSDDTEKRISVKRAGELSTEAWAGAFQERFFYSSKNGPESQRHMAQVMSELDTTLRSSAFHPFMKIQVAGKDEWEVHDLFMSCLGLNSGL
jgi:hypothetical protein